MLHFFVIVRPHSIPALNSHRTLLLFFFFNDTATTEIYTLSLHDALPIYTALRRVRRTDSCRVSAASGRPGAADRSEEHTSELQSQSNLVCRLLLEKKNKRTPRPSSPAPSVSRTSARANTQALRLDTALLV